MVNTKTLELSIELVNIKKNIIRLLNLITEPTVCTKCGKKIWFVKNHKTGKDSPITNEALNHFVDCPFAKEFRRKE